MGWKQSKTESSFVFVLFLFCFCFVSVLEQNSETEYFVFPHTGGPRLVPFHLVQSVV